MPHPPPGRIPSADLEDWGAVAEPDGTPVSRLRGRILRQAPDGSGEAGVWECTPGRWRRPADTTGTWDVTETVRKTYLTF